MSGSGDKTELPAQIGRYRILCELGVGGMATVYLGRAEGPKGFERLMAVKVVHPNLARQRAFVDMLLDEARIAARIHHPNVVPVYEIGEDGGRHFIALDYVDGETLAAVLVRSWRRQRRFPHEVAAYVIGSACEALHAAHELKDNEGRSMGIVHRDVSPQNILIGYDGVVRVTDFGVARAADRLEHTRPGAIKGKHAYMAPEQTLASRSIDRRVDVFALGVVLWEALTGKRLFKADSDVLTLDRVRRAAVPPPSRVRPGVPAALESITLRALERDPDLRFPTARDMGQALREMLASLAPNLAAPEVEAFLAETFPDRRARREELRRRATDANPADLERPASDDALSLSNVEVEDSEATSIDGPSTMEIQGAALAALSQEPESAVKLDVGGFGALDAAAPTLLAAPAPSLSRGPAEGGALSRAPSAALASPPAPVGADVRPAALAEPTGILSARPAPVPRPREPTAPATGEIGAEGLEPARPARRRALWLGAAALVTALMATVVALSGPEPIKLAPQQARVDEPAAPAGGAAAAVSGPSAGEPPQGRRPTGQEAAQAPPGSPPDGQRSVTPRTPLAGERAPALPAPAEASAPAADPGAPPPRVARDEVGPRPEKRSRKRARTGDAPKEVLMEANDL